MKDLHVLQVIRRCRTLVLVCFPLGLALTGDGVEHKDAADDSEDQGFSHNIIIII